MITCSEALRQIVHFTDWAPQRCNKLNWTTPCVSRTAILYNPVKRYLQKTNEPPRIFSRLNKTWKHQKDIAIQTHNKPQI